MPAGRSSEIAVRPMAQRHVEACVEVLMGYPWIRYDMTRERARNMVMSGLEQMAMGVSHLHVAVPATSAVSDSAVQGFVWWMPRGAFYHSGYIRLIGVLPSAHGRGVGRVLMQVVEEAVIAESRDMFLLVSDFNVEAQAFYQHLGYAHVGALADYVVPGIRELLMHKRLR
jgi:ribosomal protein S18 acetylase RimI-like enzyme